MSLAIRMLPENLPAFARQALLAELFKATAAGFDCPLPPFDHLASAERLQAYAVFTREQAEKALASGRDIPALKNRLFRRAVTLGRKARRWLGVKSRDEVMEVGRKLYRAIGIDLRGDNQGSLTISHCYFSRFYSCRVCELISALDDGIFSGLSGGGRLTFTERLTEGKACCQARLAFTVEGGL